ncbi:unnamed protein product [Hapterophycus canaliculatus]
MPATSAREIAEYEASMNFEAPFSTSVLPRWQRKQQQQQQQQQQSRYATDTSACSVSSSSSPALPSSSHLGIVAPAAGETRDRCIPSRSSLCMSRSNYLMHKENDGGENTAPGGSAADTSGCSSTSSTSSGDFHRALECNLVGSSSSSSSAASAGHRVLASRSKAPAPEEGYQNGLRVLYNQNKGSSRSSSRSARPTRHIPSAPVRILDAPDLLDDYYLNLLSWGSTDVLAVALGQCVYLWNAKSGDITELCSLEGEQDYVSSVSWTASGTHLAVGTAEGATQFWDTSALTMLRSMDGHSSRVGALAWNEHVLTSGSRDTTAVHHDLRTQRHAVGTLRGHTQEVCGLSWSPDGTTLASGSNDNTCCLWDASVGTGRFATASPRFTLTDHQAAVKALAWCPFERNTLATGGGTADRCIKTWNAQTGALLNSVDTGSQVLSLLWSKTEKELLSSHGYAENQLCLWKYPSMVKTKELSGHTSRVLHMAASPDGRTVVSGAGDETLRFWDVFAPPSKSSDGGAAGAGRVGGKMISGGHMSVR